jgi:hypothetical protein
MSPRTGSRRRLGSIRLSLILLALVPSVTLAAMWGVTTIQMFSEGLRLRDQTELSKSTGAMGTEPRSRCSRSAVCRPYCWPRPAVPVPPWTSSGSVPTRRSRARQPVRRDPAGPRADQRPDVLGHRVGGQPGVLPGSGGQPHRHHPQQALDQYTSIIDDQIHAFQELSQVDDGDLTSQAGPLVALEHSAELVSQEDAQLHLAWPSGKLDENAWTHYVQLVNTRRWLVEDQLVPSLRGSVKAQTERILQGPEWKTLETVEDQVLAARAKGLHRQPEDHPAGHAEAVDPAFDKLGDQYTGLIRQETAGLLERSNDKAEALLIKAAALSAGGSSPCWCAS